MELTGRIVDIYSGGQWLNGLNPTKQQTAIQTCPCHSLRVTEFLPPLNCGCLGNRKQKRGCQTLKLDGGHAFLNREAQNPGNG